MLYYLHGALGSVVGLADADGELVEKYEYDPYGRTYITAPDGTARPVSAYGNPFAWTGQRYDPALRLYHFWARSYSPALGRWLQRDPLEYVDGVGLYEYVGGGPLGAVDPLGLEEWPTLPGGGEIPKDLDTVCDMLDKAKGAAKQGARTGAENLDELKQSVAKLKKAKKQLTDKLRLAEKVRGGARIGSGRGSKGNITRAIGGLIFFTFMVLHETAEDCYAPEIDFGWYDDDNDGIPNYYDHDSRYYDPVLAAGDEDDDGIPNYRDPRSRMPWEGIR